MSAKPWNLVADIGGTNARFGLVDRAGGGLEVVKRYSVADHGEFTDALTHFLRDLAAIDGWLPTPTAACFAVACPPEGDVLQFTNSPWSIDRRQVSRLLGEITVDIINDFTAVGHAITDLKPGDWHQIGGAEALSSRPIAVLGPGTGLGVCSIVPCGASYCVVEGEGGHVDFAPLDSREIALLEILIKQFGHVSVERLLSGAGILTIYQSLAQLTGISPGLQTPAAITEAAVSGSDTLAVETLEMFCRILGAVAGNLALALGAKGGVYVAGGIVPRFLDFIGNSDFRARFEAKGRFHSYLAPIPLRIIVKDDLGLHGASKKLKLSEPR